MVLPGAPIAQNINQVLAAQENQPPLPVDSSSTFNSTLTSSSSAKSSSTLRKRAAAAKKTSRDKAGLQVDKMDVGGEKEKEKEEEEDMVEDTSISAQPAVPTLSPEPFFRDPSIPPHTQTYLFEIESCPSGSNGEPGCILYATSILTTRSRIARAVRSLWGPEVDVERLLGEVAAFCGEAQWEMSRPEMGKLVIK
jgi:hypothetical protein